MNCLLVAGALLTFDRKQAEIQRADVIDGVSTLRAAGTASVRSTSAPASSADACPGCDGPLRVGPWTPPYVAPHVVDLASNRTLYVVNYSHLDTQWRWSYPLTIEQFLPDTILENLDFFGRFPSHVINWTGANRYQMIKEYYPEAFRALKEWVNKGRWFPAGNQWEECDVLVPSSESIIRQVLLGSRFFKDEFGTESQEFMLPDSFGFPASLPSLLAHTGLRGFSTQKLTWKSAVGIPFHVGKWQGVDGRGVIAALDAGNYGAVHRNAFHTSKEWISRLDSNGKVSGLKVDYLYNGTGDVGGAPHRTSMKTLEASVKGDGPVKVIAGPADLMFRHISDAQTVSFPTYAGDLLLTEHSAGSLSSQAFMKRLNRMNELLADAAERASVASDLLGACPYPASQLRHAWQRTLGGQFHDIISGTAIPKAYEYSWNDDFVAMNEFAYALTDAVAGIARGLDTRVMGLPLVIYNPLSVARTDLVEAALPEELENAAAVTALNEAGKPLPTQLTKGPDGSRRIVFSATVPGLGFAVYALRAGTPPAAGDALKIEDHSLSNTRYQVTLNGDGDVVSLRDLQAERELLSAPIRMAFMTERPRYFPAWNMDWADHKQKPRGYVTGSPKLRVIEAGPVRVALQIERESEGSSFVQTIRLAAGPAGERVEFLDRVDWKSSECSLKATFPLSVSSPKATYSWDLGTIERGNNNRKQYEVPTHSWLDLTDSKGDYGVTLLTPAKYGSDKPTDDTLRLTLLFTPSAPDDYREQRFQDWGRHDISYALVGHAGNWRAGKSQWHARRFEQPLLAFAVPKHAGTLGKSFSLLELGSDQVAIQAIKRAEDGQGVVVRLQELLGQEARVRLSTPFAIAAAQELNGVEKTIAPLPIEGRTLRLDFLPYQIRSVGLSLVAHHRVAAPSSASVKLDYDLDAMSFNRNRADGNVDGGARTYPAEMLADKLQVGGVVYELGSRADGNKNALVSDGQVIALPPDFTHAYVLAAAIHGGVKQVMRVGAKSVDFNVATWSGLLGQWDNRVFAGLVSEPTFSVDNSLVRIDPAYLRTDRIAWSATHRHHAQSGDEAYANAYLFSYAFTLPPGATTLTLPRDSRLRIFAISVAKDDNMGAVALVPLWPDLSRDAAFHARFDGP
jgi:alpha-mannosidase